MLLQTIERPDSQKMVKLVCIEALRSPLPQIHSVPALVTLPERQLLFGKAVFDYLLLPRSGKLIVGNSGGGGNNQQMGMGMGQGMGNSSMGQVNGMGQGQNNPREPAPFIAQAGGGKSMGNFASLEDMPDLLGNGGGGYTPLDDFSEPNIDMNTNVEVRQKKQLPDLSKYQEQRSQELNQTDLNVRTLPPPIASRG